MERRSTPFPRRPSGGSVASRCSRPSTRGSRSTRPRSLRGYDALPEAAREYLEFVADEIDTPIYAVGVGPDREETVELTNPFDE